MILGYLGSMTREQREAMADAQDDDFAGEHDTTTVADQLDGGPEEAEEPESPEGRAGMD